MNRIGGMMEAGVRGPRIATREDEVLRSNEGKTYSEKKVRLDVMLSASLIKGRAVGRGR
jgi:hypothetical protein